MKLLRTPVIRLTLLLLCGLVLGNFLELPPKTGFFLLLFLLIPFLLSWQLSKKLFSEGFFFGIFSSLLFVGFGIFIWSIHQPRNQPQHYLNKISSEKTEATTPLVLAEVSHVLKPDLFSQKAIAEVRRIDQKPAEGKLLLLLPKEGSKMSFLEGQQLLFPAQFQEIPAPKNPHQFNYRDFMDKRKVPRQVLLYPGTYTLLERKKTRF